MSNDWWARKLNAPAQPQAQPQPQPQYVAPQPATYAPPSQPQYPPTQQVTQQAPRCPGCGGPNYSIAAKQVTHSGQVESWRCYDCGYPLVQAGSSHGGANSAPSAGPAQKARQVQTGGWNPTTIIGHL